jgi:hypothetical protein
MVKGDVRLRDIHDLELVLEALNSILTADDALARFVNAANMPFVEKIPPFIERVNVGDIVLFPLTKRDVLRNLHDADILQIVRSMVQSARDKCGAALDSLHQEYLDVRSGAKKRSVTEWYLAHIREAVNDFVTVKGYDLRAVPQ